MFQKCSAKQIAAQLGLSLSMVYKWAEPGDGTGSGAANLLDRLEALLRRTKDPRLIQ
jgi:transposase